MRTGSPRSASTLKENSLSTKKLSPKYYMSSKQRNSKKFFGKMLLKMMRELGFPEEEIKEAHEEIKEARKRR